AIQALRVNPRLDRIAALAFLQSPADAEWQASIRVGNDTGEKPRLVQKATRGFDVYFTSGSWFAIPTCGDPFDSNKAKSGDYLPCLRADSRDELELMIRARARRSLPVRAVRKIWRWSIKAFEVALQARRGGERRTTLTIPKPHKTPAQLAAKQ
ncbi:MAG TPA: hypothetical protein VGM05_09535, partial [Planctomycetaceae bacterium]